MKKIIHDLKLNQIGWLEMLFALMPMLSGYGFGELPMSFLMFPIIYLVAFYNRSHCKKKFDLFKPILILLIYVAIHDLILVIGAGKNFNGYITTLMYLGTVLYVSPVLNLKRLIGSLNWVALIAICGLLYQLMLVLAGQGVRPLDIPFLTMSENRMEVLSMRPSSFFMEPAAYTAFMFVPMAFALMSRKYLWTVVLIFCVFLTGSTTGLLTSFIMLVVYMLTQHLKTKYIFLILTMAGAMLYALQNFEIFEVGMSKMEEIDVETNMRLSQGPYVVGTMRPQEFFTGAFYGSPYQYCKERAREVTFYTEEVYMSTFWYMTLMYGVVGLLLYLNVYLKLIKQTRLVLPLVVVLLALMFSSAYSLGIMFIFTTTAMLVVIRNKEKISI